MDNTIEVDRSWKPHEIGTEFAGTKDLAGWLDDLGPSRLAELLVRRKALVFRDFDVTPESIDGVFDRVVPGRLPYVHGNSPRTKVGRNLYTSTEYPQQFTISMHNELSYAHSWPSRLAFYCEKAAESGGATPVLDGALWLDSLDAEVLEAFAGGVRYVQNLHDGFGFGKSWQQTFETEDRAAVEEFLAQSQVEWEWGPEGIRITQHRTATTTHPVTGAEVWFNQADQWHPAGLGDKAASDLYAILEPGEFPQHVTFADGSTIPDAYVEQIQNRALDNAVDVAWRSGDVLLIDNVLTATAGVRSREPAASSSRWPDATSRAP